MKIKRKIRMLLVLFIFIIIEFIAYRAISSQLALSKDNYIANLICEHWYRVAMGLDNATDLGIFYPINNSVGFLDMMLHLGIPYTFLRVFGLDMYMAIRIAAILLHGVGTIGLFYLLHRKLNFSIKSSLIGILLFSIANSYMSQMIHIYLLALSFVPILIILLINIYDCCDNSRNKVCLYSCLFMSVLALICYSSVYIAMFFVVFSLVFTAAFFLLYISRYKIDSQKIIYLLRRNMGSFLIAVLVGITLMIPFLKIYLPLLIEQSGGYSASDVLMYSPTLSDFWNVGVDNWVYGHVFSQLGYPRGETVIGLPLIESFLIIVAFIMIIKYKKKSVKEIFFFAIALTTIGIWLVITQISDTFSVWVLIRTIIPGLSSMRAIARFCLFLLIPISIVLTWFLDRIFNKVLENKIFMAGVIWLALIGVITMENITMKSINSHWSPESFEAIENPGCSTPPDDCDSFFIVDSSSKSGTTEEMYEIIIRAWAIGYKYNIKSISGIGSVMPYGTDSIFNPYSESYESNICRWVLQHQLENVYAYDSNTNQWISFSDYYLDMETLVIGSSGIDSTEKDDKNSWNWVTNSSASIEIYDIKDNQNKFYKIDFETMKAPNKGDCLVDIYLADEWIASFKPGESVRLSIEVDSIATLTFKTPGNLGYVDTVEDNRKFAFAIENFNINGHKVIIEIE